MNADHSKVESGFWVRWVIASAIGLLIGFAVFFPLVVGFAAEQSVGVMIPIAAAGGAILGSSVGVAQRLVLQRSDFPPRKWVLFSAVGGAVGGIVAITLGNIVGAAAGFQTALVIGGAVLGVSLGIGQWFILRQRISQAGWWVLASMVGMTIGLGLGRFLGEALYEAVLGSLGKGLAQILATVTFATLLFGGFGAITGIALLWLLRQSATLEKAL